MEATRKAIRIKRVEKGWSQGDLAQASGVSIGTIGRIERGRPCTSKALDGIAAAFGCSVGELL